jgi:transposase
MDKVGRRARPCQQGKEQMERESQSTLGIDVSKATLDVVLLVPDRQRQAAQYANTPAGIKKLAKWLRKRKAGQVQVCLEATGLYGDEVALFLHEAGHTVSVVNPARIKAYAASQLQRNKTDRLDAALIADFCRTQQPPAWEPPDPAWRELRALARHLLDLKDMRQQERNRLQAGVTSDTVRTTLQAHIAFIQQQIDDLEQHIRDHIDHHPDLKRQRDLLDSIPGIGHLTASLLVAEIGDLRRFDHAGQVVAFAGLNPRHRRSGSSVRGQTPLSKTGSAILRRILYFPAISARRHNPVIAPWCDQLAARGKTKMQIIGAAMRKLLVIAYGVLKSGQPFDPHFHLATP